MLRFSIRYVSTETSDDFVDCRTEAANCFCILANMYNVEAMMRFAQMLYEGDRIPVDKKETLFTSKWQLTSKMLTQL